ncbi:MAG TPA: TraR/DksA C4-type zinc finger protein [Actinomycetota bacterium]|nr:TraR/DksA C4-type zinc finger protein [Actinomycetota bacterium]
MPANDPDFLDGARRRLTDERDRLTRLRDGVSEETSTDETEPTDMQELSVVDQHPADVGSEVFERQKDIAIVQGFETELADIETALGRIEDGTYGTCETCGKTIPKERLEAKPAARFCVEDQARAEAV